MNYKKLRSTLRKEFLKEISRHPGIDTRIRVAISKSTNEHQRKALSALSIALDDFVQNIQATTSASLERTILIEKQIDKKCFDGKLHDNYHTKSQQLRTNYHNSVQNAKRLANSLTSTTGAFFNHSESRGLRFSSFGKFYQSIKDDWDGTYKDCSNSTFLFSVTTIGDATENTVHKYRDNVLEHSDPERPQDNTSLVTRDGKVEIASYSNSNSSLPEMEYDASMTNWIYQSISDKEGRFIGEQYLIHTYLRTDLKTGDSINKGDPIAVVTDLNSGHFKKYGPHTHTFSSPNVNISDDTTGAKTPFEMPEVSELAKIYLDFTEIVLNEVERRLGK